MPQRHDHLSTTVYRSQHMLPTDICSNVGNEARMSARRPLGLLVICAIALLLLSGCVVTISPARALVTAGTANAREVAVAIQANGIKHYAWTECSGAGASATCQLVYERRLVNAVTYQYISAVAAGAELQHPDIAATADGRAFIVHRVCSSGRCTDYYTVIPADAPDSTTISPVPLASPGAHSAGSPKVKARGNFVYAVYLAAGETNPRLRYRQLSGGSSGGYVDVRASVPPSDPSLAIGSNGVLHVVWKIDTGSSSEVTYGSNSGTSSDFGLPVSYDAGGNYDFDIPDIALDSNNTPYIVYSYDDGTSDLVKIRCEAEASKCYNNITTLTVPLNAEQNPWRLRGSPHIQVTGSAPMIVFSADTSTTSTNEIWYYTPPSSGADSGPTRVTTNDVQDDEPLIVEEQSNFGDVAVVAWRTYITVSTPPTPRLPAMTYDCLRDGYSFYSNNTTVRRVFNSMGGCLNSSQDLAANGPWVAAAWIDRLEQSGDRRAVPWTTFNAHTMYAPIITN
jgi:hypothetical protein